MEERMKILEMLANGIISVDEANELLKTLDNSNVTEVEDKRLVLVKEKEAIKNKVGRILRVEVLSSEGDKVNVNLPINFIKTAIKTGNANMVLNNSVNNKAFDQIDIDILIQAIDEGIIGEIVSVDSANGDIVRIYIE